MHRTRGLAFAAVIAAAVGLDRSAGAEPTKLEQGLAALDASDYDKAEKDLKEAAKGPKRGAALLGLAKVQLATGKYADAHGSAASAQKADPAVFTFHMGMHLGRTALAWTGECSQTKSDFPKKGAGAMHCVLNLIDSHDLYVGGQLTTNTITSLNSVCTAIDPPGYTQASIATMRLWKHCNR